MASCATKVICLHWRLAATPQQTPMWCGRIKTWRSRLSDKICSSHIMLNSTQMSVAPSGSEEAFTQKLRGQIRGQKSNVASPVKRLYTIAALLTCVWSIAGACLVALGQASERDVKAAFLFNFAKF